MSERDIGVGHHGDPILTERDARYCRAMVVWISTARKHGGFGYGPDWLPGSVDVIKSRLFWRLRCGKAPLPHPPPTCYSCPWYEVVEELTPHWTMECWSQDSRAYLGQCGYKIEQSAADGSPAVVSFGPWRFKVWKGKHPLQPSIDGWYIQREPDATAQATPSTEDSVHVAAEPSGPAAAALLRKAGALLRQASHAFERNDAIDWAELETAADEIAAFLLAPASRHPEERCQACGGPNVVWFAPSDIWNAVCASQPGIICPVCFMRQATAAGFNRDAWRIAPEFYTETDSRRADR